MLRLAAVCLFSVLALASCLEDPAREPDQWPIARAELEAAAKTSVTASDPGEAAYRKTCIACHGADGKGLGGKTGADFTLVTGVLTKADAVLLTSIRDGATGSVGVMPPHRTLLSDGEVAAVLAYVRRTYGPSIVPIATVTLDGGAQQPAAAQPPSAP